MTNILRIQILTYLILEIMGSSQKKSNFFKKFACKFSIDYCDQSLSDNLYIKLYKDCLMKIDHSSQSKFYKYIF